MRRLRRRNTARRAALLTAVAEFLGDRVEMTGDGAGAQIVLWPKKHVREADVMAQAAASGVGIYGIAHCYLKQPSRPGFMLGYARLNEREIREGVRLLADVF